VSWFRRVEVIEAEPETDSDRLAEIERDYRIADGKYIDAWQSVRHYVATHPQLSPQFYMQDGKVYVPVNANQRADVELQRLERVKQQALTARNELLRRRSELMMKMGLIK
jgi:hypothetical protein